MRNDEFIFITSTVGSMVLVLVAVALLHLFGSQPLWLPLRGGENINPTYINVLAALVPTGSLLGFVLKSKAKRASWRANFFGWLMGCALGCVVFYSIIALLAFFHPLLISGAGLSFAFLVLLLTCKKARTKPARLELPIYK